MLQAAKKLVLTYVRRRGPLLAQGIAYSLLIGSTPLLLLSMAVASLMYSVVPSIQNGLHWRLRDYVPEQVAQPIIERVESMASGWAGMGVVGVLLLLLVSKGIFDSFGSGLSAVMENGKRHPAVMSHLYSFLLTLLAILSVIVISLDDFAIKLIIRTANLPRTGWMYRRLADGFSVVLLGTVLFMIYLVFSGRRVRISRTVLTALVVSLMWHLLGTVGKFFISMFARYRLLYGVFSGAVLFLVWLQVFAHLVLLGGLFITRQEPEQLPGEDMVGLGIDG
ncbi:MAG: YihY family inner membrane protein [Chitinivibrionales bacterium]|nr:YihY family inner membrane protein [Chitinivibrionales bacterium]